MKLRISTSSISRLVPGQGLGDTLRLALKAPGLDDGVL